MTRSSVDTIGRSSITPGGFLAGGEVKVSPSWLLIGKRQSGFKTAPNLHYRGSMDEGLPHSPMDYGPLPRAGVASVMPSGSGQTEVIHSACQGAGYEISRG